MSCDDLPTDPDCLDAGKPRGHQRPRLRVHRVLPGSAELNQGGKSTADSLARLLSERPELSLTLCGRSTGGTGMPSPQPGRPILGRTRIQGVYSVSRALRQCLIRQRRKQAFTELAAERMRAVRRHLTEEKGIDAARISECRPTVEAADQGRPRVDVSL